MMLEKAGFTVAEAATGAEATRGGPASGRGWCCWTSSSPTSTGSRWPGGWREQGDRPVIVLTSTREASDYGGQIAASPAAGFLPKDQLSGVALRGFLADEPAVSRRLRAVLIAGAVAAATFSVGRVLRQRLAACRPARRST